MCRPWASYSNKLKSLKDLPEGAKAGISERSVVNGNRALLLLQKYGVIKLKPGVGSLIGVNATPLDVAENPKKIKLVELDAAQFAARVGRSRRGSRSIPTMPDEGRPAAD